jgi:hypothetical protein
MEKMCVIGYVSMFGKLFEIMKDGTIHETKHDLREID